MAGLLAWLSATAIPLALFSNGMWMHGKQLGNGGLKQVGGEAWRQAGISQVGHGGARILLFMVAPGHKTLSWWHAPLVSWRHAPLVSWRHAPLVSWRHAPLVSWWHAPLVVPNAALAAAAP